MNNPVAPVVTDEMVEIALHKWFESEGEEIADLKADRICWEIYQRDMRAAITAALEVSGELERLRAALSRMLLEFDFMIDANMIADVRHDVIFVEARAALEGSTV